MKKYFGEKFIMSKPNWRFPDKNGLYERNLDCLQLSIKEILYHNNQKNIIETFLNPFDCNTKKLTLRRRNPTLNFGWNLQTIDRLTFDSFLERITEEINKKGYALVYFDPFHMKFSKYYKIYHIKHWFLVIKRSKDLLTVLDESGSNKNINDNIGQINIKEMEIGWRQSEDYGIGILTKNETMRNWDEEFNHILQKSVENMKSNGLNQLNTFIKNIRESEKNIIISHVENLEFDVQYFKKLRELWKIAALNKVITHNYYQPEWVEEIYHLCNTWGLVLGVLMKWKRQPEKDYKDKLLGYLEEAYESECRLCNEFENMLKGEVL